MKVEEYRFDEGYGYGFTTIQREGMTVNEIILELTKLSKQGYGDRIVFDYSEYPIKTVDLREHGMFEILVPRIY